MFLCTNNPKVSPMLYTRARITRASTHRRGGTIIIVIAFFAVAMALLASWVQSALTHQRQVRRWHQESQVVCLAESGVRRAVAQLAKDQNYRSEEWIIEADSLGGIHTAEVSILVEPIEGSDSSEQTEEEVASSVQITVVAIYPIEHKSKNKHTKSIEMDLSAINN